MTGKTMMNNKKINPMNRFMCVLCLCISFNKKKYRAEIFSKSLIKFYEMKRFST